MKYRKPGRLDVLLFLLFFYVIIQLGWWAFLISKLTRSVYAEDPRLNQKIWMIWGEGIVFALLLLLGFIITYKSYLRELIAARQQRNFLLSVTHEFKTPISSLKLILETLQSRTIPEEKKNELIRRALGDTDRLNILAENILLATRMESDSYPVFREEKNLSAFVEQQVQKIASYNTLKHSIITSIEKDIYFPFDDNAFVSIITNLVENAIKYSPRGSSVEIVLQKKNNIIQLIVKDNGPGIPLNEQKRIFDRFVRLESEETRSTKGTGLGLYIVKNFVEKHDGKISVQENQPKGSIFTIEFKT